MSTSDAQHKQERKRPGSPWVFLAIVVVAGAAVYANSFAGVFVHEDVPAIVANDAVQQFDVPALLRGRPLANLSFAVNHDMGGLAVGGYHAVNLAVHLLAACALFGLTRRTLLLPGGRERLAAGANWIAFATALLWVVHPLGTAGVTYIVNRSEALAGLFSLLTLYAVARSASARGGAGTAWYAAAIAACALGMASKAVVVTVPVLALLYDRVFIASSFRELARRRWALYAGLAATWGVLVASGVVGAVLSPGDADPSVIGAADRFTSLAYLAAQPAVILHYLRLAVWPTGLSIDYWWMPPASMAVKIVTVLGTLALLAATIAALWKRPRAGFAGAAFFLLLVPTSSVVPTLDLAADHRMYLPLAAVIVLVVIGVHRLLSRPGAAPLAPAAVLLLVIVAAGLGAVTIDRNRDYHSVTAMWRDVATKRPQNPRAAHNLGTALADEGELDEALVAFRAALQFPEFRGTTYLSIAQTQRRAGRIDPAIEAYTLAIEADPSRTAAQHTLANLLVARGRIEDALPYYREVAERQPESVEIHADYGRALAALARFPEAVVELERAIAIDPSNPQAQNNLGGVYALQGRLQVAMERVIEAIRLDPDYTEAIENLGRIMVRAADPDAIVARYREQVDLTPAVARTWAHRGDIAMNDRQPVVAISLYRRALELEPTLEQARAGLARAIAANDPDANGTQDE